MAQVPRDRRRQLRPDLKICKSAHEKQDQTVPPRSPLSRSTMIELDTVSLADPALEGV